VSRRALDGSRGLAVDGTLALHITKPQWQVLELSLLSSHEGATLSEEERTTGALSAFGAHDGVCSLQLPGGEGVTHARSMIVSLGRRVLRLPMPEDVASGRRVAVRLQLFPDGRCGIAIDGRPVFVSDSRMSGTGRVQLLISGNAHGTEATVGPLQLWSGVRPGITWPPR
jgi:hypothetical protein